MNEHIVKPGTYIPVDISSFPSKPDEPTLSPEIVKKVDIEHNYPFLDKSFKARFLRFIIYIGIYILVFTIHPIRYGLKIEGRKNLRKAKKLYKNGIITVSNHVYRWDFLAVLQALRYRKMYFPARALQVMSKDATLIRSVGGIPVPETISGMRGFYKAFDEIAAKKTWIHFYPESCRWDYYEPIRPLKTGVFKMALRYDRPILPMAFSFREPKGIYKLFGVKHPLITIRIGEVIPLEKDKYETKKELISAMRKKTHDQMVSLAGIEKNMWPDYDPSEQV